MQAVGNHYKLHRVGPTQRREQIMSPLAHFSKNGFIRFTVVLLSLKLIQVFIAGLDNN